MRFDASVWQRGDANPSPRRRQLDVGHVAFPTHKAFDRLVLGKSKSVVKASGVGIPVLGALPELANVLPREEGAILLRFVLEDGIPLADNFAGT